MAAATRVLDDAPDPLDGILAEFSQAGHYARLQRLNARKWDYLPGRLDVTHDLVEDVRAQFGGGTYKALVYSPVHKYLRTIEFSIAGRPLPVEGEPDTVVSAVPDYLAVFAEKLERLTVRLDNPPAAQTQQDPFALALKIVELTRPATAAGGDVITTMQLIHDAEARGETRGREIGGLLAGVPAGGDSMADVVKQYLPDLIGVMRSATPAPVAIVGAPVASLPPAPAPVTMILPAGYEWLSELRPLFSQLHGMAVAKRDPELLADFALDQMSETMADRIEAVAARDDFIAIVVSALPQLNAQYPEWLARFVTRVRDEMQPDGDAAHAAEA